MSENIDIHMNNEGESGRLLKMPVVKLMFDKVIGVFLAIITLPLFIAITVAIYVSGLANKEYAGSVFFMEKRISQGEKFNFYKFRLFKASAVKEYIGKPGVYTKSVENVPENLTPVGRFLKKWGFDELPQIYLVIKGDISLVGPRPAPINEFEEEINRGIYRKKIIKTGLTGPVQILKGTGASYEKQIQADMDYIEILRKGSALQILKTDSRIALKTIMVMLKRTGE